MTKVDDSPKKFRTFWPFAIGFGTILLLLGGFAAWASKAEIDGAVVATGRMVVDRNRQAVQHLTGGVVDEIFVTEGDTVQKGDILVKLDPSYARSELTIVAGQLYELMARRGRLEAERDEADDITFDPFLLDAATDDPDVAALVKGQNSLFRARAESLEKAITQLHNQRVQLEEQIVGIDAQTTALSRQLELIKTETTSQETLLAKGLAQSSRVLGLQREDARLAGTMGELIARRAQARERISELEIQELQYYAQRREEAITILRDLQYNELEMAERRQTLIRELDQMDIRAPVAGIIYDLRVFGPRSVIRPADPILFLIPQDRALLIEAQVDPMNVNDVFVTQEVVLKFRAFDMRNTPDLFGRVTMVSPDAFTDPQSGRSYYRVEIEMPPEEHAKLAEGQSLLPGMPVDTFIRTGEHTPLTYIMAPLSRYFSKALRDSG